MKVKHVFDEKQRTSLDLGHKILIKELEFEDKEYPTFNTQESMRINIRWEAKEEVKDIRGRLEIFYADGTIAGMAESKTIMDVNAKSKGETKLAFNLKNLATGTYYFRFTFFTLNSMGIHTGIEETAEKIFFKVIDTVSNRTGWLRQYWGSVRFDDLQLIK
jgi:hypothetical protein